MRRHGFRIDPGVAFAAQAQCVLRATVFAIGIGCTRGELRIDQTQLAGEPQRNDSFVLHGLASLPIRWTR